MNMYSDTDTSSRLSQLLSFNLSGVSHPRPALAGHCRASPVALPSEAEGLGSVEFKHLLKLPTARCCLTNLPFGQAGFPLGEQSHIHPCVLPKSFISVGAPGQEEEQGQLMFRGRPGGREKQKALLTQLEYQTMF